MLLCRFKMKKIFYYIFLYFVVSFVVTLPCHAQPSGQTWEPNTNVKGRSLFPGGVQVDSYFVFPFFPVTAMYYASPHPYTGPVGCAYYDRYGDSAIHYNTGLGWVKLLTWRDTLPGYNLASKWYVDSAVASIGGFTLGWGLHWVGSRIDADSTKVTSVYANSLKMNKSDSNVVAGYLSYFGWTQTVAYNITVTDTTHYNLAWLNYVLSGSYSSGTITFTRNDATTFTVTGLNTGTVTSIATGWGLLGGTITNTGTLIGDSSKITSVYANSLKVSKADSNTLGSYLSYFGWTQSIAYNLTAVDTTHYNTAYQKYTLSGSFSSGTVTFTRNDGTTWTVTGFNTGTITSVSGTANRITSTGGATPVIDIAATYVGQTSITTLGTIGTGTWQGTAVADGFIASAATWNAKQASITWQNVTAGSSKISLGGTPTGSVFSAFSIDVNEANLTISNMGGTLGAGHGGTGVANNAANTQTFSGNFGITWTLTGTTAVTMPTSGTVATLSNRLDQFVAPNTDLSINSHKLTNVTDPSSAQDAVTLNYLSNYALLSGATFTGVVRIPQLSTNSQSGTTYTLVLTDAGKWIVTTNAATKTITIPPQSSVAWAADTYISFRNSGAGKATLVGGAGVTINSTDGNLSYVQYAHGYIVRTGTDTWEIGGKTSN